jgi:TonB family protein
MANVGVPLKFQILKGDELIREQVVTEAVIKVGKLASSHLRIDDESVSRMHAVIEINGPDDVQLIDLGSTRGTLVNGEKVTKARLNTGDEITFGDVRVVVTFVDDEATSVAPAPVMAANVAATAVLPQRPPMPPAAPFAPAPQYAPPPQQPYAPPPQQQYAPPPPQQQYAPPPRQAPQYAAPASFPPSAGGVNPMAAEVEVHDGTRAVEVQALYRGVVINTRHLYDHVAGSKAGQAKGLIGAGAALVAAAVLVFLATVYDVGREKNEYDAYVQSGKESKSFNWKTRTPAVDFVVFGGILAGLSLVYMGLKRKQHKDSPVYLIGTDPHADAPVDPQFTGGGSLALVSPVGGDFIINATPQMSGEVVVDNQALPLQQYLSQRGGSISLGDRGRARLDCGDTTFLITATPKPRAIEVPFFIWRWSEQVYTVGSVAGLLLFLLMIFSVPPDPKSLSLDLFNADNRFVNFLIKPPEEKEEDIPEWLKKNSDDKQGGKGKRHKGEEGKMGKKTSKNKEGLYGLKGPKDNPDPHLAKKLAEEQAKSAGILGVLKMNEGSHLSSIFGRDTALGNDPSDVLGGLIGNQIGEAYGVGGLGLVGTGSGGGGTGEGTIGLGNLGTIGKGGGGGNGSGYGRGAGGLGGRRAHAPDVIPGQANVRGSLDKEIIRRIIRRHINEVKYCYEQELLKKPELAGRVVVQFTISASGQVVASVLQTSTMGNARVENCTVQAVRRWEFPKPLGGGIVIVSYPFVLTPAGGGAE